MKHHAPVGLHVEGIEAGHAARVVGAGERYFDDGEQVKCRAGEAVYPRYRHHVAALPHPTGAVSTTPTGARSTRQTYDACIDPRDYGLNDSLVRRCGSEKGQRAVAPRARNFRVLGRFRFCVRLSFCRELSLCDAPENPHE